MLIISVIVTSFLTESCKKGEEDPNLSIYSRKQRLCKSFDVTSYKRTEEYNDTIIAYTFTEGMYAKTTTNNYYYNSPGSMSIQFSKDGSYTWEQTNSTDTSEHSYIEKGLWYFTEANKETDIKKKEQIILQKTEISESFSNYSDMTILSYNGSGDLSVNTYRIKKLSSEEVIIIGELENTYVFLTDRMVEKIETEIILTPL